MTLWYLISLYKHFHEVTRKKRICYVSFINIILWWLDLMIEKPIRQQYSSQGICFVNEKPYQLEWCIILDRIHNGMTIYGSEGLLGFLSYLQRELKLSRFECLFLTSRKHKFGYFHLWIVDILEDDWDSVVLKEKKWVYDSWTKKTRPLHSCQIWDCARPISKVYWLLKSTWHQLDWAHITSPYLMEPY